MNVNFYLVGFTFPNTDCHNGDFEKKEILKNKNCIII